MRYVLAIALALSTAAAPSWTHVTPMPHVRSAHAVVATAGGIYVLGGPSTAVVERFDGRRWRRETTLPGGIVNAPAAAVADGTLVVTGGFRGSTNEPTADVRLYDVRTRSWRSGAPLPAPR